MKLTVFQINKRVLKMFFKACPIYFSFIMLIGIFHGISWGMNTVAGAKLFDAVTVAVVDGGSLTNVYWMLALLAGVTIACQILNGIVNFGVMQLVEKAAGFFHMEVNRKAARIDPVCFETTDFLDDINKANEGSVKSLWSCTTLVMIFSFYLPYFIFMAGYLYILKPSLIISLVFVFIPVFLAQIIRSIKFSKLEDQKAPLRREFEYYERCIADREYLKETRLLGGYRFFRRLYNDSLHLLGKKIWDTEFKSGMFELLMRLLSLAGYFGILSMLFFSLIRGEISVGSFAAVFSSIGMLFGIMEELVARHMGNFAQDLGTVRNFIRFLDLPERTGDDVDMDCGNGITLDRVTFGYPGTDKNAVEEITLAIRKGETVAIVGENGSGKTTLVKLMVGLFTPTNGDVWIDQRNTKSVSPKSVYRSISGVFQKFVRYKMDLKDNVAISEMGKRYDQRLVEEAVEKADFTLTESFTAGYDTMLSREFDGIDLSGGQWQRIAIARGFYRASDLIILDEPTAAIDPIEETKIYNQFAELAKDKTAILVTHRLGSAKIADTIVVMDNGRIVQMGTHDQLIQSGKYAEMYNAQAKWYDVS